jgi:predicted DsbA family dithiol-disulfide isomerase
VTWLPFDLHPEYPPGGIPREQLHERYGDAFHERLKRSFEAAGLVYNPPPDVVPNTMRALSLTELARDRGLHRPMHDRLMHAYWEEARNIGDPEVLREIAVDVGLGEAEVAAAIEDGVLADRVRASTAQAQSIGVTGVPAFVLDNRVLVLGAQPRGVFEQVLAQLHEQAEVNAQSTGRESADGDDAERASKP